MKVYGLKVNGVKNPVGFAYGEPQISWKVGDTEEKKAVNTRIEVSEKEDFTELLYQKEGELNAFGEPLNFNLKPHCRYFYRVMVTGEHREQGVSETSFFETAKMQEPWEADWIGPCREDAFHPELCRRFSIKKEVKKASLYICGLGLFETYVNGKKAGEDYLAPFINDYPSHFQYMTYDVTELLSGENEWTILLGNGWYKGRVGFSGQREVFGDRFAAIAELWVFYADGAVEVIPTDSSWSYRPSAILESDIYDGEVMDQQRYETAKEPWKPVDLVPLEKEKLCERYSVTVKPQEELAVKEVIHTPAGETVLDMGQNFAGYMEVRAQLQAGTRLELEFGEVLQQGNFYRDNYRSAKARFIYIYGSKAAEVRPHFTFFGFRYVRVTGWPGELRPECFVGRAVYSDLESIGSLKTGNDQINRLYSNCLWGQKSNFLDMPTDCPQRDERLGWTGDTQVFAPTASYHMDTRAFYDKFLRDLRYDQLRQEGRVADYLPNLQPGMTSSVWGDVATFVPFVLYDYFGDLAAVKRHYPLMKDWVEYIRREDEKRGARYLFDFGFHYGDWLALDGVTDQSCVGATESYFISSVYYHVSAGKLARAARLLGKEEEAEDYGALSERIREAVLFEYFTPSGRLAIDTQTAYYIALKFGVYIHKERILEGLRMRLKKDCYKIKSGFVGATMMCSVLAEHGLADVAYDFLFNEKYPGWLHCIGLGASTIWERWNSVLDDGSISGTGMNSLNHYAYGSVMEFVYAYSAGLRALEPGFGRAMIAPLPDARLKSLDFTYDSAAGLYRVQWELFAGGRIHVQLKVPFGASAVVRLPGYEVEEMELLAGSYEYEYVSVKDYGALYHINSRFGQLKEDPRAMEIIGREQPRLAGMIADSDAEQEAMALAELYEKPFFGFERGEILELVKKLEEIRYEV
ncbi:MAG: family 78 glycoside hydrolase catalytic domain [Lachnospiraceae bacterium]|nr:family 78 glycoside hydrolase catalytic domain [Lachnospiraceae bacterium]MCI9151755.1 family 78 glycoside hydrolase catalytic domain [Lachnospiraceae bacterium]